MATCIHAKKEKLGKLSFRVWSSITDSYITAPMSLEDLRRWSLFRDGIRLCNNWKKEFDVRAKRAASNGTSDMVGRKRSLDNWDKNMEPNSNGRLPVLTDVDSDFPELSTEHKAALDALPPEVAYVAAAMLRELS